MKLCAVIILYYPDIENLENSLPVLSTETELVILWKNSPISNSCVGIIEKYPNVKILGNEENVGIGKALNQSIAYLSDLNFTHLLTLDQDSYFDKGVILKYKQKLIKQNSDVAIFGINPLQNNNTLYENTGEILDVSDTITSGSIFLIENFSKFGLFDEDLFIDAVDYEYCYRVKQNYNKKTLVFTDILMNHCVGYIEKTKLGFSINNYSAFRTYFIIRNHFTIWSRYPNLFPFKYKMTLIKHHFIYRFIKIWISEDDKLKKTKALYKGILHFLTNKLGYYNVNK